MSIVFGQSFLWMGIWLGVWLVFYALKSQKITYIERHRLTALFFLSVSLLIAIIFRGDIGPFVESALDPFSLILLFLLFGFNLLAYRYVGTFFPYYRKAFELDSTLYFAKFDRKYLVTKSCEILYQQLMIVLLLAWLDTAGRPFVETALLFALVFSVGHLPLFFFKKKNIGKLFVVSSVASSAIFPYLILHTQHGFVLGYAVHWLFYIVSAFLVVKKYRFL